MRINVVYPSMCYLHKLTGLHILALSKFNKILVLLTVYNSTAGYMYDHVQPLFTIPLPRNLEINLEVS